MTGLVVVTGVLTLVVYVALRRVTPVGVGLNPWRYIAPLSERDIFERNLPRPGEVICDADPPADLIRGLAAMYGPDFVGLTRCHMSPPHPPMPGIAHVGRLTDDTMTVTASQRVRIELCRDVVSLGTEPDGSCHPASIGSATGGTDASG